MKGVGLAFPFSGEGTWHDPTTAANSGSLEPALLISGISVSPAVVSSKHHKII